MKSQPRISVLMGVYNGGIFLASAINSILDQSLINLEFIIIDDGSDDETVSILDSFAHLSKDKKPSAVLLLTLLVEIQNYR